MRLLGILTALGFLASVGLGAYVLLFGSPFDSGSGDSGGGISFERVAPPGSLGTIRGRCRLERPVVRWRVPAPHCPKGPPRTMLSESVVATDDGDLGGCVVSLVGPTADPASLKRLPESTFRLAIDSNGYRPHVGATIVRVQVVVANETTCDACIHAYRDTYATTQFNFSSAPSSVNDDAQSAFLHRPGLYPVRNDCDPEMHAWLHVFVHPWFDVTSAEPRGKLAPGEFLLENVPPGDHEVVAWHESMRRHATKQDGKVASYSFENPWTHVAKVHVVAGKATVVDFTIPVPAEIPFPPDVYVPR